MAASTMDKPADPPGRKEMRYHKSAVSCSPLEPKTKTNPLAPPAWKVKYIVKSMEAM